jgi:hypothetical protein
VDPKPSPVVANQDILAIASALEENKGLVDLILVVTSDERRNVVRTRDSQAHPTLDVGCRSIIRRLYMCFIGPAAVFHVVI